MQPVQCRKLTVAWIAVFLILVTLARRWAEPLARRYYNVLYHRLVRIGWPAGTPRRWSEYRLPTRSCCLAHRAAAPQTGSTRGLTEMLRLVRLFPYANRALAAEHFFNVRSYFEQKIIKKRVDDFKALLIFA
jgi:hypothetical protein